MQRRAASRLSSFPARHCLLSVPVRFRARQASSTLDGVVPTDFQRGNSVIENTVNKPAEVMISEVPIIEWREGMTAICWGGDEHVGNGHPIEYIQLNKARPDEPQTCLYCGLRYRAASHH